MNEYRPTRVGAWLGSVLADAPEVFASSIFREGRDLGFDEILVRGAFAEIRATARPGGHLWALDEARKQFFRNWGAARGAPSLADRDAYRAFWRTPASAAASALAVAKPKPAAPPLPAPGLGPEFVAKMARVREQQRQATSEGAPATSSTPATLNVAEFYARRRRERGQR